MKSLRKSSNQLSSAKIFHQAMVLLAGVHAIEQHEAKIQVTIVATLQRRLFSAASIFAMIVAIRLVLIGLAPHADEGHYAAASYFHYLGYTKGLFSEASFIPPFGILELYSLLVSWVYFIPAEPYFLLRLVDGLIAGFTGVVIFKYLNLATNSRVPAYIATAFVVVAINHPEFIEAGARNPIPIATLLLFCALYLLERDGGSKVLLPACCLAGSVLVREPFIMFAGLVVLYVWQQHGLRVVVRLCWLATLFGASVILLVVALKGGVSGAVATYDAYTQFGNSNPTSNLTLPKRIELGVEHGQRIISILSFCFPAIMLGLVAPLFEPSLRTRKALSLYVLGVGLTLAPLVEIFLKRPYSYHVAQMFIGVGVFVSYGVQVFFIRLKNTHRQHPITSWSLIILVVFGHLVLLQNYARTMRYAAGWSIHFAPVTILGEWTSPAIADSYYLQIASLVRNNSRPGDPILSTSYNVYPLTGRIPLSRSSASLARYQMAATAIEMEAELPRLIREKRPRVFVEEWVLPSPQPKGVDTIVQAVSGRPQLSTQVGPDLSPYRRFVAKVHIYADSL